MKRIPILILLAIVLGGCVGRGEKKAKTASGEKTFTLPEIPGMISTQQDRLAYLANHYWDNFDFGDTTTVGNAEYLEPIFVGYIRVVEQIPTAQSYAATKTMLDRAMAGSFEVFDYFTEMAEKFLYDPNSPVRNEELYIPVLEYIVASPKVEDVMKIRPQHQLTMALKNRVGAVATDFTYTLNNGAKRKMSSLKADFLILYINNPDCTDCKRVKTLMDGSQVFNRLLSDGCIKILALYPDPDLSLWRATTYSPTWINAYDAGEVIRNEQLYDLRAIPTNYLLDKDKRVILKDAPMELIEQFLAEMFNIEQ